MAKSKSGGTRAYIRGKIGADVYSIGKDGKGAKQQVVRSLAEVVSNPQTEAQMRNRMIMSTVMQTLSALSPIIDHSFDNVPNGQPALSEFIARNFALVKADVAANPSSDNNFGLNKYQEKGSKGGAYVISQGNVAVPSALSLAVSTGAPVVTIALTASTLTYGGLLAALGLSKGDYITIVGIDTNGALLYGRFFLSESVADTTAITAENVATLFTQDANATFTPSLSTNDIVLTGVTQILSAGVILSKKDSDGWKHSSATMANAAAMGDFVADVALPTYPQGASRFLNGGDL